MSEAKKDESDLSALLCAVDAVLRDALDKVDVHPCDQDDDAVKANRLNEDMLKLYKVRHLLF